MGRRLMNVSTDLKIPDVFMDLLEPYRYNAFEGGRGSAKSMSFAKVLLATGTWTPLRILCAREVQKSITESVKQLLDDEIEAMGFTDYYTSTKTEIRGINGTKFLFHGLGTLTVDQIKSFQGLDRVWIEEAQTVSAHSLEILIPTIREEGSELWFSWNPRNATDAVDQLFNGAVTPPNTIHKKVGWRDNPWFPEVLKSELEFDREHKPQRFNHIWEGGYEPQVVGAIWSMEAINRNRRREIPELERIVISVDPAVSDEPNSDENGIGCVGIGTDKRGYVLDDWSQVGTPKQWSTKAVALYDKWQADAIVIEVNQGGDMCRHTLETARPGIPIIEVRASRGKHVRAEPISSLYERDLISHVGSHPELEEQMCKMTAGGYAGDGSPDRVDWMVWGFTELFRDMLEVPRPKKQGRRRPVVGWQG